MANPTQPNQNQPRTQGQRQEEQSQPQGAQAQPSQQQQRTGLQRTGRGMSRMTGMMPSAFTFGPFALMRRLFDDLAQLAGSNEPAGELERMPGGFIPQIDVQQRDDKIVVHVDLPGIAPTEVQARIEDSALIIEGERRTERELDEGGVVRIERVQGRFRRVIPLPEGADPESAEARFANGVLEIVINTPKRQQGRQIQIQSGGEQPRERAGDGASDTAKH